MDSVRPLRISKPNTPSSSPTKMLTPAATAVSRPLSEIGSTERRRNSPSYNQATRKMIVTREASPYIENSSPGSFLKSTPRDFWHGRDAMPPSHLDTENLSDRSPSFPSSSPRRRPSVERLAQASRVKNSSMYALESKDEYDPSNLPIVERPIANRPLSQSVANNTFTRLDSVKKENNPYRKLGAENSDFDMSGLVLTPSKSPGNLSIQTSPDRQDSPGLSPSKSSLARTSRFDAITPSKFDPDQGTWSDSEDRADTPPTLRRHAKSVTFHEAPPVINEYEQQTPEPSGSVTSDREGSWDSEDFDDEPFGFERTGSVDREREDSFDEDLENADKTPVVLPEDWPRMSPDAARTDLADSNDDVFNGDSLDRASDSEGRPLPPLPGLHPSHGRTKSDILSHAAERVAHTRRVLPSPPKRAACSKEEILSMAAQSSLSLEDRLKLMNSRDTQHDRPTSRSSENTNQSKEDELVITNLDTGEKRELRVTATEVGEDPVDAELSEFTNAPPRISRESILRKVRNSKYDFEDESEGDDMDVPSDRPPISELAKMHPDEPIPSRETSRDASSSYSTELRKAKALLDTVHVKDEPTEEEPFDMSSIPAAAIHEHPDDHQPSAFRYMERQNSHSDEGMGSPVSSLAPDDESTELHNNHQILEQGNDGKETLQDAMALLTVKDYSTASASQQTSKGSNGQFLGLPSFLSADDYDFGMKEYITPSPPSLSRDNTEKELDGGKVFDAQTKAAIAEPTPWMPNQPTLAPPDSPASVIRYSGEFDFVNSIHELDELPAEVEVPEEPVIPERQATIRTGGKFKTRKSATQADLMAMAEQRRMVNAEEHPMPALPAEYAATADGISAATGGSFDPTEDGTDAQTETQESSKTVPARKRSRKSGGRMDLALDTSAFGLEEQEGLDLAQEFDRRIEAQKKGYLMRENTKVVIATRTFSGESNESNSTAKTDDDVPTSSQTTDKVASTRGTKSANSSPKKPSGEQFLQTEPWNGKMRRRSVRHNSTQKLRSDAAPPLPGKESALDTVNEGLSAGSLEDEVPEGVERGRLFVKVASVKNLDLPLPKNDRLHFQLTLDNGLHCVTTADMELGRSAPIGQEFELVVLNDLEFQLTLSTNLPPPPSTLSALASLSKSRASKQSGFSRLLSSPKKRAEKERQEREALEAEERRLQEEERLKRVSVQPTAWDLLHELVNPQDGSFARAYVNLKAHEKACFGRQLVVDVPCYNEWALEQDSQVVNSIRSKRGANTGPIRRPPYVVGQLQLQLLYVPKPSGAVDADLPKSMSSAVREINKASEVKEVSHEGHLSQEGGDCIHWRRRFFRLQGPKLTAYHEHTHQKRAVINLSKASRLVDDRTTLVAAPSPVKAGGKGRRKSAFAEEDEAYQYVEEGFRIRFANGETIDFYADSRAEKDKWMQALSQVIGKPDPNARGPRWTDLVLARERDGGSSPQEAEKTLSQNGTAVKDFTDAAAASAAPPVPSRSEGRRKALPTPAPAKSAPTSPVKSKTRPFSTTGVPKATTSTTTSTTSTEERASGTRTPPLQQRRGHRTRDAVKSMIF